MYWLVLVHLWTRSQVKVGSLGRTSGLGIPPSLPPECQSFFTQTCSVSGPFLNVPDQFYRFVQLILKLLLLFDARDSCLWLTRNSVSPSSSRACLRLWEVKRFMPGSTRSRCRRRAADMLGMLAIACRSLLPPSLSLSGTSMPQILFTIIIIR